jgi:transcriptional regulator with XRE-family HTH domain
VPASPEQLEAGRRLLGNRLRDARIGAGFDLAEAAARSGLSMQHLSDCERGRKLPSLPALVAIAGAYQLLSTDLLAGLYPFGDRRAPRRIPPPPPDGRVRS